MPKVEPKETAPAAAAPAAPASPPSPVTEARRQLAHTILLTATVLTASASYQTNLDSFLVRPEVPSCFLHFCGIGYREDCSTNKRVKLCRQVVPRAPVVPAAPVPAVPASTPAPTPVETAGYVPTAAAVAGQLLQSRLLP